MVGRTRADFTSLKMTPAAQGGWICWRIPATRAPGWPELGRAWTVVEGGRPRSGAQS
jgi:hypothetical protein